MKNNEVLVITDGLSRAKNEKKDGYGIDYRGIPEITRRYKVVILGWCGRANVGKLDETCLKVETDIKKVIAAVQERFRELSRHQSGSMPLIISHGKNIPGIPIAGGNAEDFLTRRILSGNANHNRRRIAVVRFSPPISKVTEAIDDYNKRYDDLRIIVQDRVSLLESLRHAQTLYDGILIPSKNQYQCPIVGKMPWNIRKELPRAAGLGSRRQLIKFAYNSPDRKRKFPNFVDIIDKYKSVRCGKIIEDFGALDTGSIDSLAEQCGLGLDIPGFLENCPKI